MKGVLTLLAAWSVCAFLACRASPPPGPPPPPPEGLILVPPGVPGSPLRTSFHVRVGHGVMIRLPWDVASVASDAEGLATTVARGRDVWLVGRESGAASLDVRGASEAERATLDVSIDLRAPVEDREGASEPAAPGVIEIQAGPHASARWTLARGHGSILRPGFHLKRILVGDPGVLDFVLGSTADVQLLAHARGDTNLVLESDDGVELIAEVSVRDPEELAEPRFEGGLSYLPSARTVTTWADAATELGPGAVRRLHAPYVLRRIAIGDPCIADVAIPREGGIELEGYDVGRTRLFAWDDHGVRTVLDIRVSGSGASRSRIATARRDDADCRVRNRTERCRRDPTSAECKRQGRQASRR
jgi:Flp pilus assembly secretin CpaC